MARDFYETTIALPDVNGHVVALAGVKVSVVPRDATDVAGSLVDIFADDTDVAELTNPIVTNASGSVRFWADGPAEYDLVFEDTIVPARISDKMGWNAVPAKAGLVGTPALVPPGSITQAMLASSVIYNLVPIGAVLDWWRPDDTVSVPTGFEICDGHQVLKVNHGFSVAGNINVPDLRNAFILGADNTKADGTGHAGQGTQAIADAVASAPGIRGSGGSQVHTLVTAQIPSHNHTGFTGYHNHSGLTEYMDSNAQHQHSIPGERNTSGGFGMTNLAASPAAYATNTNITDTNHRHQIGNDRSTIASEGGGGLHNNMPRWVGLLKIMKVKQA